MKPVVKKIHSKVMSFDETLPWLGPAMWILTVEYFITQLVVAAAWPGYSWFGNTISDLGVTTCSQFLDSYICSPQHALMNTSFVLLGVLMALGALLIYQGFRPGAARLLGFSLMAVAGVGVLLVGVFPSNENNILHGLGAGLVLILGNISLLVLAFCLPLPRLMRYFTLLCGVVGTTGVVLFFSQNFAGLGVGGMERLAAYPQTIWLIVFGIYISADRYRRRG